MRVAILTGVRHGLASLCLPGLAEHPSIELSTIVFCETHYKSRWTKLRRDLRKTRRIGVLGALAGIWLRGCYISPPSDDLFALAGQYDVPLELTPRTNARRTRELLEASRSDLGLSLGNSYIASRIYSTPRNGMLNVHGEVLPRFQGAASIIWAIHEGIPETGFTIHQVDKGIDTGLILYQERFPIEFRDSYPPMAPTDGNRALFDQLDQVSRDLGYGPMES